MKFMPRTNDVRRILPQYMELRSYHRRQSQIALMKMRQSWTWNNWRLAYLLPSSLLMAL
jgi:hypothetical protein